MGVTMYNRQVYSKVYDDFERKRHKSMEAAQEKLNEVSRIPEIKAIDYKLMQTGMKTFLAILDGTIDKVKRENQSLQAMRAEILQEYGYPSDYTDPKYECQKCKDTGYTEVMCECFRKALVKEMLNASGIKDLIERQTFDNFNLSYYTDRRMAQNYAELRAFKAEGDNYLMLGGTGLGKTHLSSAVAGNIINLGKWVIYIPSTDLMSDYENERFNKGESTEKYVNCDLLITDDLGTEVGNQFTVSALYSLINTRMIKRKSTIINTNLSQSDLQKRYGERIVSRLFGEYIPLVFVGNDVRLQKLRRER